MARFTLESAARTLATACPVPGLAVGLERKLSPVLSSANLFISPRMYSRLLVSLFILLLPPELLVLLASPQEQGLLIVGSLATLQLLPLLVPLTRAQSRKRRCEAELPFFLMALSASSHEANTSLSEGLRRVSAIGPGAFPAFSEEAAIHQRDETFLPGSHVAVVETTFSGHPSKVLREFVHGFSKTTETGKDVVAYVEEETRIQVEGLEKRWSSFITSIGSLAEVTFILLALFPVGLEMVGATVPGFSSSPLFLSSLALLVVVAVVFLFLIDSLQPVTYDRQPTSLYLALVVVFWVLATGLYYAGRIPATIYFAVPLLVSLVAAYRTRQHHLKVRCGEEQIGTLLHDLAEESKAGVSLPEALSKLAARADSLRWISGPVLTFYQSVRLGLTPTEAQRRVRHPAWLVRVAFGVLAVAYEAGAGFEHLEDLSVLFRRVSDAKRSVTQSMIPFLIIGAIVPVISVASITFLSGLSFSLPIGLPSSTGQTSHTALILSVSSVSLISGLLLSKLLTQTSKHQIAIPVLMASTLISILVFPGA